MVLENIFKSSFAGALIAIGGIAYVNNMGTPLAPFLFSIGLIGVVVLQLTLYTGRIGYVQASVNDISDLFITVLWNFWAAKSIGSIFAGTHANSDSLNNLVAAKLNQPYALTFILAIGCGVMMYLAVEGYKRTHSLLLLVFPVAIFITCGFEHCVANIFYFAAADAFVGENIKLCWLHIFVAMCGNSVGSILTHKITNYTQKEIEK